MPTLWTYELDGRWYGHVDWKDHSRLHREGPFRSEAEAAVVVSRKNGMEPPVDTLEQFKQEQKDR
jgi:hypothetical protein